MVCVIRMFSLGKLPPSNIQETMSPLKRLKSLPVLRFIDILRKHRRTEPSIILNNTDNITLYGTTK